MSDEDSTAPDEQDQPVEQTPEPEPTPEPEAEAPEPAPEPSAETPSIAQAYDPNQPPYTGEDVSQEPAPPVAEPGGLPEQVAP